MSISVYPVARKNDLYTTDVGDETVVYDKLTSNAHSLNGLTTIVWNACNGKNRIESLLTHVQKSGFPDANEDLIWAAIDELLEVKLLVEFPTHTEDNKKLNRRKALRLMGMGAAASVPLISSIEVQPAIAAISAPCYTHSSCQNPCNSFPNEVRCAYPGKNNCGCEDFTDCLSGGGFPCPGT